MQEGSYTVVADLKSGAREGEERGVSQRINPFT